ncbi:MAG TPA: cytochrome c [Nitrospiraceae bacterium]|nr:cytochrome c [Nitrospiraceae bacterium]
MMEQPIPKAYLQLLLIACSVGWTLTAISGSASSGISDRGKIIYEQRCAVCHGPQGRGDGPEAPFLSPRPGNLVSAGTSVKSDADLMAVIADGKPRTAMPAWKDLLTEEQRRDVLAYIRALVLFYKPPAQTPPNEQH